MRALAVLFSNPRSYAISVQMIKSAHFEGASIDKVQTSSVHTCTWRGGGRSSFGSDKLITGAAAAGRPQNSAATATTTTTKMMMRSRTPTIYIIRP